LAGYAPNQTPLLTPGNNAGAQGTADVWSYGGGIAVADLLKEGSILGIYGGIQPQFGNVSVAPGVTNGYSSGSPVHLELFYKYPVTDNISVTPGVIWLNNPSQINGSSSQLIGVIRGTYKF